MALLQFGLLHFSFAPGCRPPNTQLKGRFNDLLNLLINDGNISLYKLVSSDSYGLSREIAVLDRKLAYLPSGDPHGWNGEPCASMDIRGFSHGASPVEAPLGDPDVVSQISDTAKIIAKPKEKRTFSLEAWHERYIGYIQ